MKKTILVLTVVHKKPLPDKTPLTDVAAQRLYGYLYSQGVEAGVTASLLEVPPQLDEEPLPVRQMGEEK